MCVKRHQNMCSLTSQCYGVLLLSELFLVKLFSNNVQYKYLKTYKL